MLLQDELIALLINDDPPAITQGDNDAPVGFVSLPA
jgi:hypothetical protein